MTDKHTHHFSMSTVNSIQSSSCVTCASSASAASASSELAKFETQLSDWVHCPSSKTSAGKAKIAEITDRIESIKAQMKQAEDAKVFADAATTTAAAETFIQHAPSQTAGPALRFDGTGTWVNMQV